MIDRYLDFEKIYKDYYLKKINNFKDKYPEITSENRRTGKALKNICFFIWSYAKNENNKVIDLLLKSSILLSAQDDFCDSLNISDDEKNHFYEASKDIINGKKIKLSNKYKRFIELTNLWKEILKEVKNHSEYLYQYWKEKSLNLNDAMEKEGHILRRNKVDFDEYIEVATNSIGITFIWANYFVGVGISKKDLDKIDPILSSGAKIVRLSNDIASHRRGKNRINAISINEDLGYKKEKIINLIKNSHSKFINDLSNIKINDNIKEVIKDSVVFLEDFYKQSDFDQ